MSKRYVRFDMNRLSQIAAESVGAEKCISIEKYPDGQYNKAFVITMDNSREVVAKVPNPNAGLPHFTTASEVATMSFVSLFNPRNNHWASAKVPGKRCLKDSCA